jgi:hypothetical protein
LLAKVFTKKSDPGRHKKWVTPGFIEVGMSRRFIRATVLQRWNVVCIGRHRTPFPFGNDSEFSRLPDRLSRGVNGKKLIFLIGSPGSPWHTVAVPMNRAPASAEQLWERRRANRHLRLMEVYERLAQAAEVAACSARQSAFANRYRELIGVLPEQRQELRETLVHVHGLSMDELLSQFQRR